MFWQITASDFNGKSADQIRRARNPVNKAVANLISVIGDKRIDAITRDDMLDFREGWADRLEKEGLTTNSANKDLTHIGKVLRRVTQLVRGHYEAVRTGKIAAANTSLPPASTAS